MLGEIHGKIWLFFPRRGDFGVGRPEVLWAGGFSKKIVWWIWAHGKEPHPPGIDRFHHYPIRLPSKSFTLFSARYFKVTQCERFRILIHISSCVVALHTARLHATHFAVALCRVLLAASLPIWVRIWGGWGPSEENCIIIFFYF